MWWANQRRLLGSGFVMVGEPALVITVAHIKISFTNVINIAALQINCCEFREKILK